MSEKLKFLARGTACVPDPHGADANPQRRRTVGKTHKEVKPGTWGWIPNDAPDELLYHHDLAKAVKDGDLWAADEATAKACGVDFDPTFGGEDAKVGAKRAAEPLAENYKKAGSSGGKGDV